MISISSTELGSSDRKLETILAGIFPKHKLFLDSKALVWSH